jgi:hypothetical protein
MDAASIIAVLVAMGTSSALAEPYMAPVHSPNDCHARIIDGPDVYWPERSPHLCDYADAPNFDELAESAGLGRTYCVDMDPEEPANSELGGMFCNGYFEGFHR